MPLLSGSASGKLGDALVFFPWKGLNVVRKWLKPTNPELPDQGTARLILGGMGRACKPVADTSVFKSDALECAVAPQTWISALIKYVIANYMTTPTLYEAQYTAFEAHTQKAQFTTDAGLLGLTDFDVSYKGTAHLFSKGMQLYLLGLYGVQQQALDATKFNRVPYTTALASWTSGNVDTHKTNIMAV